MSRQQGDVKRTGELATDALRLAQLSGDKAAVADALQMLAHVVANNRAKRFEEAVGLLRELPNRAKCGWALCQMGAYANHGGPADRERAIGLLEEALAIFRSVGHTPGTATALADLAYAAFVRGDLALAFAQCRESVTLRWELRDRWGLTGGLDIMAGIAMTVGQPQLAARLFGASDELREAIGVPIDENRRPIRERDYASLRAALSDDGFAAEWAAGRAMPLEQVIAEALAMRPGSAGALEPENDLKRSGVGLTRRELEVLRMLAAGHSNREISQAFSLSERTVEHHVLHVLTKLGVSSRTAAAAYAHTHGLA